MTFTMELIKDIIKVNPYTTFHDMSNGSVVRVPPHTHTQHTHTHGEGTVFITSTDDAGGKKSQEVQAADTTSADTTW